MTAVKFPEWIKTLYRGLRAGFSAGLVSGIAAVELLHLDLKDPKQALQLLAITFISAFGTAFLVAFGKWLRELLDAKFGYDEKSLVAKVMPF